MKYMGSKNRIAKDILPIILKNRKPEQWYVEPFCGGCNMIDKVNGNRIANDINKYLIAMFKTLQLNWEPPIITKDVYTEMMKHKENYPEYLIGWVGFNCSYSGKFFGGFAGKTPTKIGTVRDYQKEAIDNIKKQIPKLKNVNFFNLNYWELSIPEKSIIYCDPPYENTTSYKTNFNHEDFWEWCRKKFHEGHDIFISEYNAPNDFECLWEKQVKSSLSANGKFGYSKISLEKLFRYRGI